MALRAALVALLLSSALSLPALAGSKVSDSQIKAAFLFNFARYVSWPDSAFDSPESPITIAILDDRDFREVTEKVVEGKQIDGRSIEVVDLPHLAAASRSHIVFVGSASSEQQGAIVASLADTNIFSVADSPGFAAAGGVANFVVVEKKVRFEINPDAARRAGLNVSSKLLRLARLVD